MKIELDLKLKNKLQWTQRKRLDGQVGLNLWMMALGSTPRRIMRKSMAHQHMERLFFACNNSLQ